MDNILETIDIINSLATHMYNNIIMIDGQTYFLSGGCLEFSEILKKIYPDAITYIKYNQTHVITRIGDKYYDASGYVEDYEKYHVIRDSELELFRDDTRNYFLILNIGGNISNLFDEKEEFLCKK